MHAVPTTPSGARSAEPVPTRADEPDVLPLFARAILRLGIATTAGIATGLAVGIWEGWAVSVLAGWNAGTFLLLGLSWWLIARASAADTKARAGAEDPGRTTVWGIVSFASAVGLFAAAFVMRHAKSIAPYSSGLLAGLALAAVTLAWLLTHTVFALRYARLYYRLGEGEGGLVFPGEEPPDDFDFAYFSFTIGMCFQVSDVTITSRTIRRTVLVHALISFGYNTAIVALALNLFFTLLG